MQRDYFSYLLAVASIGIAILVSWYFYDKSVQRKDPIFAADYLPSTVFDVNQKMKIPLKVLRESGEPLTKSVHVGTHTFANLGNAPIVASDVLTPVTVQLTAEGAEIVSVSITRQSRNVVGCSVRREDAKSFTISFRILEQEDGCEIRIFYAGQRSPKYSVSGEIVGVKSIAARGETFYDVVEKERMWKDTLSRALNMTIVLLPFLAFSLFAWRYMRADPGSPRRFKIVLGSIVFVGVSVIGSLYSRDQLRYYGPAQSVKTENWTQVGET